MASPTDDPPPPDMEALLAAMQPPTKPSDVLTSAPALQSLIEELEPISALAALAGMATDPIFQAKTIRLDQAIRLVAVLARGQRRTTRSVLSEILNRQLAQARVNQLEDPIEDFFVEPLRTPRGDFLIFSGIWEKAAALTEALVRAFNLLPEAPQKRQALDFVYALIILGDALVRRAGVSAYDLGPNDPWSPVGVPKPPRLAELSRRVLFTWEELDALGLGQPNLIPFILAPNEAPAILDVMAGDSVLEAKPLVYTDDGLLVAAPGNFSTAIRLLLIDIAVNCGVAEALQDSLFGVQSRLVTESGFERLDGPAYRAHGRPFREFTREISDGRYLHVLQSTDGFEGWPSTMFGEISRDSELQSIIENAVATMRENCAKEPGFREGISLIIVGAWGHGRAMVLNRPADWPVIVLEPADAAVLGGCEGGGPSDIWRLARQLEFVRAQGFSVSPINGYVNLFEWWRSTDWSLVPPHEKRLSPPVSIRYDTGLLLKARVEAAEKIGRRTLPHPDGRYRFVNRFHREVVGGELEPIFAVMPTPRRRALSGAVIHGSSIWWLEQGYPPVGDTTTAFETWKTGLQWLNLTMPPFLEAYGADEQVLAITIEVEGRDSDTEADHEEQEIELALELKVDPEQRRINLRITSDWHRGLYRADNLAEVLFAAKMLEGVLALQGRTVPEGELRTLAERAAGSSDVRWRHMLQALNPVDYLNASGLIQPFKSIPQSAGALVKTGLAWNVRSREADRELTGKASCTAFLGDIVEVLTISLCNGVRMFNRQRLVTRALENLQAAQAEQRGWAISARALRSIHGIESDFAASFEVNRKVNASVRAASILVEFALAEGSVEGGLSVGQMDLEELSAHAMLIWDIGDTLAAMHGDAIRPKVQITPTGEILYEHKFEEEALAPSAELRHARERRIEAEQYVKRFEEGSPAEASGDDGALEEAMIAEYGDHQAVFSFISASALFAERLQKGVFVCRRSELLAYLTESEERLNWAALVDRLTMWPRKGWDDVPVRATATDFDISKFDRRFSLIATPIPALDDEADPSLVIAPGMLDRAIRHNIGGALSGSLQGDFWRSKAMRRFASSRGAKSGLEFNDTLAQAFRNLGLTAWPSAKPSWCLNHKATDELKRLGDIDVLAISPSGRVVWVIEAKDLKLCRSRGESARRLSEYRGRLTDDGKPDKMQRHLARVEYVRRHRADLAHRLKLDVEPTVRGLVVVNAPQPMQFTPWSKSVDGRVVMLDDLAGLLWE